MACAFGVHVWGLPPTTPPAPAPAGGESTTMALVAERWGLIPELRQFSAGGKPVWGTCAGLIFLADRATSTKEGGQVLLGGLDCVVQRNFFGAQINSFEAPLPAPPCLRQQQATQQPWAPAAAGDTFRAMFIRAPAITEAGPGIVFALPAAAPCMCWACVRSAAAAQSRAAGAPCTHNCTCTDPGRASEETRLLVRTI